LNTKIVAIVPAAMIFAGMINRAPLAWGIGVAALVLVVGNKILRSQNHASSKPQMQWSALNVREWCSNHKGVCYTGFAFLVLIALVTTPKRPDRYPNGSDAACGLMCNNEQLKKLACFEAEYFIGHLLPDDDPTVFPDCNSNNVVIAGKGRGAQHYQISSSFPKPWSVDLTGVESAQENKWVWFQDSAIFNGTDMKKSEAYNREMQNIYERAFR
jgi:hypothetical protein